jgi:5S rRNA maturation endonuclease (ribonuclease M5)
LNLPVIGVPGVDSWVPLFARALRNRRVVVLADGDDNGQGKNFAARVSTDVDECATILFDGTDVNKYRMDFGLDALREKIELDR